MTWLDRVRPTIEMISPSGQGFSAYWIQNSRSKSKELGIFKFPKVKGALVQDLEIDGATYPLTIYFEGQDHDQEAESFWTACDEAGTWKIMHPVKGILTLQLMSVSENIDPVISGNITVFDSEWIEPMNEKTVMSDSQLKQTLESLSNDARDDVSDQFCNNIDVSIASERSMVRNMIERLKTVTASTLSGLNSADNYIGAKISSIREALSDAVSEPVYDIFLISGLVQNLIQLPAWATTTALSSKTAKYLNLASSLFDLAPDSTLNTANLNKAYCQELFLSHVIIANAKAISLQSGEIKTIPDAMARASALSILFTDIIEVLDDNQALYKYEDIDYQYFSQTESYSSLYTLVANTIAYLIRSAYSLKKEKRFTLQIPRAPIEITITEYGGLGTNDELFDQFISSNALEGNEIMLLPAGHEVVVYV